MRVLCVLILAMFLGCEADAPRNTDDTQAVLDTAVADTGSLVDTQAPPDTSTDTGEGLDTVMTDTATDTTPPDTRMMDVMDTTMPPVPRSTRAAVTSGGQTLSNSEYNLSVSIGVVSVPEGRASNAEYHLTLGPISP